MAEIIKVFKETIPTLRFIGKKYDSFGHWDEWWQNGWFERIEEAMGGTERILGLWENGGGYIGLERWAENEPFSYFIGMLAPENTRFPTAFSRSTLPGSAWGPAGSTAPRARCTTPAIAGESSKRPACGFGGMRAAASGRLKTACARAIPRRTKATT